MEEAAQSGSTNLVIDPPSPIRRHVKWKMVSTKKTGQMMSEASKEIADKIDSLEEQASQGSFVAHGRQDVLTVAIGRPEHPVRVCATGVGLALPPKPAVGPSAARVSTKESCVDPLRNDIDTGDSEKCGLYIKENPPRLDALGKLYEGSTTVHNIPLRHDKVKVGVEEVRDADALIPIPTEEVQLVGQTLNTFVAWLTHFVKRLSEQGAVGSAKPTDRPDHDVDDPLYLMILTIPQLFLKPFAHLQMVVILPKENVVIWFCSLHNRSDNCLKGIINSALKGLDDTPQSKSKAAARWIVVKYFNDAKPLELERLKALCIQWANYYLKVKNKTISV
ncbi:hypothetical protein GmHk_14G041410 [Glycine max]|nr:hypothetical protein GmHk_14G041410 [Glycine max]